MSVVSQRGSVWDNLHLTVARLVHSNPMGGSADSNVDPDPGIPLLTLSFLIWRAAMSRFSVIFLTVLTFIGLNIEAMKPASANTAFAQYYPPPAGYGYAPPSSPPPCYAVTPGPFRGAARGAAGGALIGAISGNAGRGAAIGAGFGALRGAVRRGSARSAGACY